MRFLKNTLLAAFLSFAFISCEDDHVNQPGSSPYLDARDIIGSDIGVNVINPDYALQTVHNDIFIHDNGYSWRDRDYYYYGMLLYVPLDDGSKKDTVRGISIALNDSESKTRRYYVDLKKYNIPYYDGGSPNGFVIDLLSPALQDYDDFRMVSFLSPEYICKIRLYNSNGDSTKAIALKINSANYIRPETVIKKWLNQNEMKLSFSITSSSQSSRYVYGQYYNSLKINALQMTGYFSLSPGNNAIIIDNIPGEMEYISLRTNDRYKNIKRYYSGKIEPLTEREYANLDTLDFSSASLAEYLPLYYDMFFVSAERSEAAVINSYTNTVLWRKSIQGRPTAVKFNERKTLFYAGFADGSVYSFDPTSGDSKLVCRWDKKIKTIDIDRNYVILTSGSGHYYVYYLTSYSGHEGLFSGNFSGYNNLKGFTYNSAVQRAYGYTYDSLYSYSMNLNTGTSRLIKTRSLFQYGGYFGGGENIFLSPNQNEIILASGAAYSCSADYLSDLQMTGGRRKPLNSITWKSDDEYIITTDINSPYNVALLNKYWGPLGRRLDLAGVPLKAVRAGDAIKVYVTLKNGKLAVQTFTIEELKNNL